MGRSTGGPVCGFLFDIVVAVGGAQEGRSYYCRRVGAQEHSEFFGGCRWAGAASAGAVVGG